MTARVYCAVLLCLSGCLSTTEAAPGTTVKPGVCPRTNYEVVRCIMKGKELCADDSECPKKEKCCSTACGGRQCTAPVTVKPGVCPNTKYEAEVCTWIRFASCADDSECPNNEKCCSNGCGLQCMAPDTAKPGVCPITNDGTIMCVRKDDELCASDSECPDNQKCCSTICNGLGCMAPVTVKPGVCPSKKYKAEVCTLIRFVSCADDSECPKNEKCCSNGCELQCTAPVTAKPGVCPITNDGTIMCVRKDDELCASDSECPDNQKCCSTTCNGLGCMAPVTVKPGVCPRTNYEVVRCKRKDEELCADDSECPKKEKCCRTKCGGHQCMAPVTVKPGVCPRRKYKPEICARIRFVSCADDRECPKNEKCCNNGCGLQCMAPVTVLVPN